MLDYFNFYLKDAWLYSNYGYEAILETTLNGKIINWLVDGNIYKMKLLDREEEFIKLLRNCGIKNWNNQKYINPNILDGVLWHMSLGYSKKHDITSSGMNGFPDSFEYLLKQLHSNWGLPISNIEKSIIF